MDTGTPRTHSDLGLAIRVLRYARPYLAHLIGVGVISLLTTPLALLMPVPLKIAVDNVLNSKPLPSWLAALLPSAVASSRMALLGLAATIALLVGVLMHVQAISSNLLRTFTGERLVLDFRTQLFGQLQRVSLLYHDRAGISDSSYRIQYDAQAVQSFILDGIIPLVSAVFTLVAMGYVTVRLDFRLSLVALSMVPIMFTGAILFRAKLRRQWGRVKEIESSGMAMVQDALGAARVVRAFGQEGGEHSRFISVFRKGLAMRMRVSIIQSGLMLLISGGFALATALVLFVGIRHVLAGTLTLGGLLMITGYLGQIYLPLQLIATSTAMLQSSFAGAGRVFAVLDQAQDVEEKPRPLALKRADGGIEFAGVSFSYPGKAPVLQDVSFSIAAGSRVGIIGATGSGKTTLLHLVMRFYDSQSGRILLDGTDLRDLKVADLRNQFAVVLQDPVLLARSIAENVAYSKPSASFEEIVQAAKIAKAHDFIIRLPDGYDTIVGDRGILLSGGERQRISLARAFLKDAPILILDEATSAMDVGTEAEMLEAMSQLIRNRTTFIVAHRLSMIEGCDSVLVIDNGRVIVQQGSLAVRGAK